jgi:hypothetical protein
MRRFMMLTLVAACSGGSGPDRDQTRLDELEPILHAFNRVIGLSTAFVAEGIVNLSVDPSTNALAIYQKVKAETGTCATATPNGPSVQVGFNQGCTLATAGMVVDGTTTVTVQPSPSPQPLDVHFDYAVQFDGRNVAGTLEANTTDGNVYGYAVSVEGLPEGVTGAMPFFMAGIASGGAQLNGSATATGKVSSKLTLTGLHQAFNSCYPDEGTVRVRDTGVDFTVTFDNTTPSDGLVQISESGAQRNLKLPKTTGCPR